MKTPAEPAPQSAPQRGEIAWVDGSFLPRQSLFLPVGDAGFVLGATVTEQLRTFRGRLFVANAHQERLHESLQIVGIDSGRPLAEVFAAAAELAARNHAVGPADDDLGLVIFVTPGDQPSQHRGMRGTPRTVIHTFPLAFRLWADAYDRGVPLRLSLIHI